MFSHVRELIGENNIEQCGLPFSAAVTNMQLTGLLAPMSWNGYWLVDGAVVN
ncbi:putative lysophospholipase nte1 [Candidatus Erwinia dacicola]|uniref:Lysophospholipase nte1 n=1 Tax=Candidatus Erwinia dacicola TaxID=252393 RepID=A0A328TR72_9GAMM|nr:putative lysophospholipase nte1 [Candidatus Erwinia dacicola]